MQMMLDAQELANSLSSDYLNMQKYAPKPKRTTMQTGIYKGKNGVYYAFRASRGSGKVWPYVMTRLDDGNKAEFTYSAQGFGMCAPADRLTLDECESLSLHLGYCVMCGKELTVKKSVLAGMGPVCRKKYN